MMALTQLVPSSPEKLFFFYTFLHPSIPLEIRRCNLSAKTSSKKLGSLSLDISCSAHKIVRSPSLDRHVVEQNRVRFVQMLKTLLLSKPKHYIPIQILYKCRSYLSIEDPRTILPMIRRYPTIFQLFTTPTPHLPMNATKSLSQLCVTEEEPIKEYEAEFGYHLEDKVDLLKGGMVIQREMVLVKHEEPRREYWIMIGDEAGANGELNSSWIIVKECNWSWRYESDPGIRDKVAYSLEFIEKGLEVKESVSEDIAAAAKASPTYTVTVVLTWPKSVSNECQLSSVAVIALL